MLYTISETSLQTRKKNIFLSALLSVILVVVVTAGHFLNPETYNDLLFWSVIFATLVGNLVNYYRYRRYLRLAENHRLEINDKAVAFFTGTEKSVLNTEEIVTLTFFRKKQKVEHIQLKLKNNRGIRLEGYTDMDQLGDAIANQIPKQQVFGRAP